MFITVCGWIFCVVVFISCIYLAWYVITTLKNITHLIPYPTKQENGAVAHRVPATWYGWRSKETHEWKIIPRYAILRGLAIISPIIWACTVIAFAI